MSLESELRRALHKGRSHEVHMLTQLLGEKGIGVRKRLFFHLLGSRPDREEMEAHVTKPGRRGEWTQKWTTCTQAARSCLSMR